MIAKFISEFFSGLSSLGKKLLIIALIVVIITSFDRLLIAPTMSRLATIDEETVKEEKVIKEDLHFLSYKDKILREAKAIDSYFTDNLPTEDEIIGAFLKKIEIVATKANVTLAKVTPSTAQQEKDNLKYSADLECSGKLTDIVSFMHLINSLDELTKIVKFSLGSKKADLDEIKATMTIDKVIISRQNIIKLSNPTLSSNTQADASTSKKN